MIEEIKFIDTTNKVSVTIDNETQELPIKKIEKLGTYIELNQSLNTALKNNIQLDASLFYIKKDNDDPEEEFEEIEEVGVGTKFLTSVYDHRLRLNIDGHVTVTVYDNERVYYQKDIAFTKGHITDSIKNYLPLGEYSINIEYSGNKYFEPCSLSANFSVERRLASCFFPKDRYNVNFCDELSISGFVTDAEKRTPIPQCVVNYIFDGEMLTATTNNNGEFIIDITIPEPNIEHCSFYDENSDEYVFVPGVPYEEEYDEQTVINEDESISLLSDADEGSNDVDDNVYTQDYSDKDFEVTYPNASYVLSVYIDDESYYLDNAEVIITTNKAPTMVTVNSINTDVVSNTLNMQGGAIATYNKKDNNIVYGNVNIELPKFHYNKRVIVKNGVFQADIDLPEVYSAYNVTDIEELIPYDATSNMSTYVMLSCDDSVEIGDAIIAHAEVSSLIATDYIKYGLIIFTLYDEDDKVVHKYSVEIDRNGTSVFNFNTSHTGIYYLQAEYIGIFGYHDSQSDKHEVRVINGV